MFNVSTDENSSLAAFAGTLNQILEQASELASELGDDFARYVIDFDQVCQRLGEGRFHLAVLGQFKRGKSTLLNALLGDDLLPTDILPVTAIPTFIKSGDEVGAAVYFLNREKPERFSADGEKSLAAFLSEYVTEAGNPHNRLLVRRVEISHPAQLLKQGVVLVDTPGVGSTLKHNTEVAHQILPECDAALFLVSPDPPITEMELEYLEQIKQQLPRTFYLLNKVDFLDPQEQKSSLLFLSDQLRRFYDSAPQVMPISARKGLQARLAGDMDGWNKSGMQLVERNLIDFFAREKQQVLLQALGQRTGDLLNDMEMQLKLCLSALQLPVAELQEKLDQFRSTLPDVEREQLAAEDILAGDLKRVVEKLSSATEGVRERAKQKILQQVEGLLESVEDAEEMERRVQQTVAGEIEQFFAPAMQRTAELVQQEASAVLTANQKQSDKLIEQVRRTAAELFDIPYHAPVGSKSYRQLEAPAWSSDLFISDMDPLGQTLSRKLFSKKFRRRRTVKRLREESRKLVNQNVAQIHSALHKSLEKSFRAFGAELREQLEKTISATRKAMELALQRSEAHSQAHAARELLLQQSMQKLLRLKESLTQ
ncbi:Dynamin family protein [Malonomonas rubra DSM 5091]|uniref:Dynamin family protein n=1 Tax=Malonomonas rubra DSM 5091 TaxID=1122189 RepID=A0A1M6C525_MALRU|nr:dynamin family protein [Malonomonas rubra]SHI56120.1 Dynamin family protein [Malonomonas rubra DSM 5091]